MRGIIGNAGIRSLKMTVDEETGGHARRLNERVMQAMEEMGLKARPMG